MTKDEILAIQPGLELDALVAEKIFQFQCFVDANHSRDRNAYPSGMDWFRSFHQGPSCSWHFSTDIKKAWEVAEKHYGDVIVQRNIDGECYATFYRPYKTSAVSEWCKSVPEAICKAALLALMDK